MRRYLAYILTVFVIIGGSISVVLFGSPFLELRRSVAADYIGALLDKGVMVKGDVAIDLGIHIVIDISDVAIDNPLRRAKEDQRIERVRFSFPLASVLVGKFVVDSFVLDGVRIDIELGANDTATNEDDILTEFGRLISGFLNHPISEFFVLKDVDVNLVNPKNGWDENIKITELSFQSATQNDTVQIVGNGNINDVALTLRGKVDAGQLSAKRKLELLYAFPGSRTKLSGNIDISSEIAELDLQLNSQSESLGDLLDALALARVLEGKGQLSGQLTGSMKSLKLANINTNTSLSDGAKLEVTGTIDKLNSGSGVDLEFNGTVSGGSENPTSQSSMFDVEVTGFGGKISGTIGELDLDNLILKTNIASFSLEEIGPISIGRITKDDKGRLGLLGILILNGPPEARTLNLSGDITDALQLSGINLSGEINIPTAELFERQEAGKEINAASLGNVRGRIKIADNDGTLGINQLEVSVSDSKLLEMNIEHEIGNIKKFEDISLTVDLNIPSFSAFAAALGQKSPYDDQFKFIGQASFASNIPKIDGTMTIGKTSIAGNLSGTVRQDRPFITGGISSKLLHLSDLRSLYEVLRVDPGEAPTKVDLEDDFSNDIGIDLKFDVKKIAGVDKSIGKVSSHMVYDNQVITLNPLQISYLGGVVESNTIIDTKGKTLRVKSSGKVTKLPVGRILRELGAPGIVSGALTTKFDIAGSGNSMKSMLKTLSGNVTASIWSGSLGTNLIDLSGLNVVTWLATKSDKKTIKLVCAIMPFSFKNGRGSTRRLVLETDNVQVVGSGWIDIGKDALNLNFRPIPKLKQMVDITTPFHIGGKLSKPAITAKQTTAERASAEFMAMPLNIMGLLTTGGKAKSVKHKPCVVPKTTGSSKKKRK
jgi:uncharacterized protein involved in outer membrane biogenesis